MRSIQFALLCMFVIVGLTGCSTSGSATRTSKRSDAGPSVPATAQNLERWGAAASASCLVGFKPSACFRPLLSLLDMPFLMPRVVFTATMERSTQLTPSDAEISSTCTEHQSPKYNADE